MLGHPSPRCFPGPLLVCACFLTLPSCGIGGQSTDDEWECVFETTSLASDSEPSSELGIAPDEVLSWAAVSRATTARWHPVPQRLRGSTNSVPGDVSLAYTLSRGPGPATELRANTCGHPTRLEVPMLLGVSTDDGLVAEKVPATLKARRPGFAVVEAPLDLATMRGAFAFAPESSNIELYGLGVGIALTPSGSAGSLGAAVQTTTSDSVGIAGGTLLTWPAGSACSLAALDPGPAGRTVPRDLATAEPIWLEALATAASRPWTGTSDRAEAYTLTVTTSDTLCDAEDQSVTAPATLRLQNVGGEVDLELHVAFAKGDGLDFALSVDGRWGSDPAGFIERFGDFGLELDDYEQVELEVTLSATPSSGAGSVAVVGYLDECQPVCSDKHCGGCGPLTRRELLQIAFDAD